MLASIPLSACLLWISDLREENAHLIPERRTVAVDADDYTIAPLLLALKKHGNVVNPPA